MAITQDLPLSGQPIDTTQAIPQMQNAEMNGLTMIKQRYENATNEQKKQVRDVAVISQQLLGMKDPQMQAAFIEKNRAAIGEHTDEMMQALQADPAQAQQMFGSQVKLAQLLGAFKSPASNNTFGSEAVKGLMDTTGQNYADALYQYQTGNRKDQTIKDGKVVPMAGAYDAQGDLAEGKQAGTERGSELGKAQANLADQLSSFPQVQDVVGQLHELGKVATFRKSGQAVDSVAREVAGMATPGAIARGKYIATVADVLLPLLRPTFGAQFTLQEGENLKATLGDPNTTSEEKDAVLDAFLQKGFASIQSKQRRVGASVSPDSSRPPPIGNAVTDPSQQGSIRPALNALASPPNGVDPRLWQHMTPEEQALFQ